MKLLKLQVASKYACSSDVRGRPSILGHTALCSVEALHRTRAPTATAVIAFNWAAFHRSDRATAAGKVSEVELSTDVSERKNNDAPGGAAAATGKRRQSKQSYVLPAAKPNR